MPIKIFCSSDPDSLEEDVNFYMSAFIAGVNERSSQHPKKLRLELKYQTTTNLNGDIAYSVMVWHEFIKPQTMTNVSAP